MVDKLILGGRGECHLKVLIFSLNLVLFWNWSLFAPHCLDFSPFFQLSVLHYFVVFQRYTSKHISAFTLLNIFYLKIPTMPVKYYVRAYPFFFKIAFQWKLSHVSCKSQKCNKAKPSCWNYFWSISKHQLFWETIQLSFVVVADFMLTWKIEYFLQMLLCV